MSGTDWVVFAAFLAWVVWDGTRRARGTRDLEGYYAGGRTIPWWAAGLSIMATQASAITVIGTTGQGHEGGMGFLHTYLGLPIAMVVLCIWFVPMLRQAPILTAYEFLERRFGPSTRALASLVFLVSRCAALGVVIYAPSVVLSAMTGLDVTTTVVAIGLLTTLYTSVGGVHAVVWTDVKQMTVILGGLAVTFVLLLVRVLDALSLDAALTIAGAAGKLSACEPVPASLDFLPRLAGEEGAPSFWEQKYNLWTGLLGGTFLMLAYFGCDQSQVQRILTNPSANESRKALLVSGFAKLPMQVGVLFIGVLLWLFHGLHGAPVYFDAQQREAVPAAARADVEVRAAELAAARKERMLAVAAAVRAGAPAAEPVAALRQSVVDYERVRARARQLVRPDPKPDTNYVFPHFVLGQLPVVLVGLLVAAIFAAAMSSVDSVLNSLSAATIVDFYRRWIRPRASEAAALRAGRLATIGWGLAATAAALWIGGGASIIERVNEVGSFFYGTLLGGFVLALVRPRAGELAATVGLVAGMASVLAVHLTLQVAFLWYNLIGCIAVVAAGSLVSIVAPRRG